LKKIAIAILIAAGAQLASADGLKSLESFMKGSQTGRADFTQVVTSPPKDGQVARTKTSSGTFEFQRPGRFKFVYKSLSNRPSWPTGKRCGFTTPI
jgi:outer membrane lipoprotein carrier protein